MMKGNRPRLMPRLIATVAGAVAAFAVAAPAFATPSGEFAVFAQCPLSNAELSGCISAKTESVELFA